MKDFIGCSRCREQCYPASIRFFRFKVVIVSHDSCKDVKRNQAGINQKCKEMVARGAGGRSAFGRACEVVYRIESGQDVCRTLLKISVILGSLLLLVNLQEL